MDRRCPDQDLKDKMQDVIELVYLLNKLTNNNCNEEYSKKYLLSMLDNMDSIKNNYDKYKYQDVSMRNTRTCSKRCDSCNINKNDGFLDKIIFYLKSLNE